MTKKQFKNSAIETIKTIAIALFIALLVRSVIVGNYKVPTGSMIPTIMIGDHLFASMFSYGIKFPFTNYYIIKYDKPKVGDIIVFKEPREEKVDYVKRVVAIEGDIIEQRDIYLYINGNKMELTPIKKENEDALEYYEEDLMGIKHVVQYRKYGWGHFDFGPLKIPKGEVYVIGDNRDNSSDSRHWGGVPLKNIRGKAHIVWFSWDSEDFGVRVRRLFKLLK